MVRRNKQDRSFDVGKIQGLLKELKQEHLLAMHEAGLGDRIPVVLPYWYRVEQNVYEQVTGQTRGSLKSIDTLRLSEELTMKQGDPYLAMAGCLINKDVIDGLSHHDDFISLIEDFSLKIFKWNPRFVPSRYTNVACVRFPAWFDRIRTGAPDPKTFEKRFRETVGQFSSYVFETRARGNDLFLQFRLIEVDEGADDIDYEFVDVTLELINQVRGAAV